MVLPGAYLHDFSPAGQTAPSNEATMEVTEARRATLVSIMRNLHGRGYQSVMEDVGKYM
jgi:hypothetical protein